MTTNNQNYIIEQLQKDCYSDMEFYFSLAKKQFYTVEKRVNDELYDAISFRIDLEIMRERIDKMIACTSQLEVIERCRRKWLFNS